MSRKLLWSFAAVMLVAVSWPALAQELPRASPGASGTVTMTRAEYDRLLDLASRKPAGVQTAPIAAALTRADIRVRVAGSTARATMRLDGEVYRPGVARVPLITNATVLDARMDNRPLPVVAEKGTHVALVAGPGPFSATLEVGSALTFAPGRGSFVLPVPPAGSATAAIDVPGDQTDVHLSTGLILRRSSAGGRTTIDATLVPGTATEVWWSTHDSAPTNAASRDVRLMSDVKSIVTIGDADVRLVSLVNVTIVQGEPSQIAVAVPAGYEVVSVSGASLERTETVAGGVTLFVSDPAQRRHQFLVSLERPHAGGSFKLETSFPTIPAAQRETGEVAVEGLGTVEVTSAEVPGLRRMDVREIDASLAAAARQALLAAYRYQRTSEDPPSLELDVRRFADAAVLAAVAERAVATTLVTTEGRALTEVTMWIRNRAQPFMKVVLPPGASMLSVEVAGSPAKPVEGKDGSRVPLLRPGFRPDGPYVVSFVYLHGGTPFVKKGDMQVTLPKMDVPINVVEWELFVPDRYRVDHFDGNMIAASLVVPTYLVGGLDRAAGYGTGMGTGAGGGVGSAMSPLPAAQRGQINGRLVDQTGAALPGVTILVEAAGQRQAVVTDEHGAYVANNVPSGPVTVTGQLPGFKTERRRVQFDQRGQQVDMMLAVAETSDTVEVRAASPTTDTRQANIRPDQPALKSRVENEAPSVNVQSLQRRASGVLPVRMEVPRAGTSHRFIKPLVIDEETLVTFRYKRR
ncbi:MAG TPA: carboxypeptidase-like regulatory domain-containing protein [Vicinamibacterales bacterium]|nr:carboxypeptidase-like regulatory domain-containing protein [Vicinamibacterales bacterium]